MLALKSWKLSSAASGSPAQAVAAGWIHRLVSISHRTMAICGLVVVAVLVMIGGHADVRQNLESWTFDWLSTRQAAREPAADVAQTEEPAPAIEAPAPRRLDREQKAIAQWISRRYRVAAEPISDLVQEAWALGRQAKLEPTLILAVMAVESSFNPFAQSAVGAQGLMQVMTSVHDDKYQPFGGTQAAFDPLTNLRVGVTVLKECVLRAGSLEGGLRYYVGAANLDDDGGYAARVLAEQEFLRQVAQGRAVPTNVRWTPPAPTPVAPSTQNLALPVSLPAVASPPPLAAAAPAVQQPPAAALRLPNAPAGAAPSPAKAPSITEAASTPQITKNAPAVRSEGTERIAMLP